MSNEAAAEVIELPRKVKVLCFYEARRFGSQSLTSYWSGRQSVMIEVLSSSEIQRVFSAKMLEQASKAEPWERHKTSAWKLTAYLPETMTPTF